MTKALYRDWVQYRYLGPGSKVSQYDVSLCVCVCMREIYLQVNFAN